MTETELRAFIKRGPSGGLLFYGDEDYLKHFYLAEVRRAVLAGCPPGLEAFNRLAVDAENGDFGALAEAIAAPPVMASAKIVEFTPPLLENWREPERKAALTALDALVGMPDTVLVMVASRGALDAGTAKRPNPFFRSLTKLLTPVEFPLQTGVRLRRWVEKHFAGEGLALAPDAVPALLTRCAPDMYALSCEIEKTVCYVRAAGRDTVTAEDILCATSPGIREDAFALANAVLAGNRAAALAALDVYRKRRDEPAAVLASLMRVVSDLALVAAMAEEGADKSAVARTMKIHEYKAMLYLRAASAFGSARIMASLERCRSADRLTKSAGMGYVPLERFLATIPRGTSK